MPPRYKSTRNRSTALPQPTAPPRIPQIHAPTQPPVVPPAEGVPIVQLGWILKALAIIFSAAFLFAYATLCIVFSRAQWQLVLHPSHSVPQTPASFHLAFTPVHFGVDNSGLPQLAGWWIPAPIPTVRTALILPSGEGSSANALPAANLLHRQNLNVLLFDYRGYGDSLGDHPTQATMEFDANTALTYLTATRSIPSSSIVVYGIGLGAALAVHLCAQNLALPALVLQSPDGDLAERVRQNPSAKLVPFRQLFNEPFPLAAPLRQLPTPRLIRTGTPSPADLARFLSFHLPPAR
ncbi:MAG: alpha/beta hydrolase [Acidobacteriaceae bacterium]